MAGVRVSPVVIDTRYGYIVLLSTMLVFQIINRIVTWYGRPTVVVAKDEWKWKNLFISWIHALIISTWDISSFFLFPELTTDLIEWVNYYTYYCVAASTGYFVYDFCDMIANNQVLKLWEVTLHHIAVTSMFFYNVVTGHCIAFNMIALLAEINSFFLHSRKLLQMLKISFNHWLYRMTTLLNIVSFAVFRGISLGGITYGLFTMAHRVSRLYFYSMSGAMFIMNIINPILFWRLLRNDFLRPYSGDKSPKKSSANGSAHHVSTVNGNNNKIKAS